MKLLQSSRNWMTVAAIGVISPTIAAPWIASMLTIRCWSPLLLYRGFPSDVYLLAETGAYASELHLCRESQTASLLHWKDGQLHRHSGLPAVEAFHSVTGAL